MKIVFFIHLLFSALKTYSQNFGHIFIERARVYMEKKLDRIIKKGLKKENINFSAKKVEGDTLIYYVIDSVECFSIKLKFDARYLYTEKKNLHFQEFYFRYPRCAEHHLKNLIFFYSFKQMSEHTYITPKLYPPKWQFAMTQPMTFRFDWFFNLLSYPEQSIKSYTSR